MVSVVLTYPEIADIISAIANRDITAVFRAPEQWEQITGAPEAGGTTWDDLVGYPARPHHAARYGLSTTTLKQWAARQDWRLPTTQHDAGAPDAELHDEGEASR